MPFTRTLSPTADEPSPSLGSGLVGQLQFRRHITNRQCTIHKGRSLLRCHTAQSSTGERQYQLIEARYRLTGLDVAHNAGLCWMYGSFGGKPCRGRLSRDSTLYDYFDLANLNGGRPTISRAAFTSCWKSARSS